LISRINEPGKEDPPEFRVVTVSGNVNFHRILTVIDNDARGQKSKPLTRLTGRVGTWLEADTIGHGDFGISPPLSRSSRQGVIVGFLAAAKGSESVSAFCSSKP
jgi:hypothetical protein